MVQLAAEFVPSGFFVLRTPLLPFDELLKWSAQDDQRLFLTKLVARPEIKEALFVASPDLVNAVKAWKTDPDSKRGRRVETSLVRYFLRMAGRPTPFGLFAGYSLGRIESNTQLVLKDRSTYR